MKPIKSSPKTPFKSHHKAVFFDAGGTLLRPYPSVGDVYSHHAKRYGNHAHPDALNEIFYQIWHHRNGLANLQTGISEKEEKVWWRSVVWDVFKEVGGVEAFDEFFEELYYSFASKDTWKVFDEVAEILVEFKKTGVFVGIISNWDSRLLSICSSLEIDHYFDGIFVSALVGYAKPDARIFQKALDTAGVLPHEAIHVGDSLEDDYYGAQGAGLEAYFLDRSGKAKYSNVSTIQTLKELL